jgi:DNA-binding MarR family transcriptional regulator
MNSLNPTLWRTCRVLAGATRLNLLQRILADPTQNVSQLAAAVGIGEPYASQELRRLQSRGLLQRHRKGLPVFFRPIPDPQVPSAAPLLRALKSALSGAPEPAAEIMRIAHALSNEQRIIIAQALMSAAQSPKTLADRTQIRPGPLHRHLQLLIAGGFVQRKGPCLLFRTPHHPLAQALVKLLR